MPCGIDLIFIHSNSVKLKMDEVNLTSVFMKFEKEGQSYEIPLTGHKVILQPNTSTIAFRARDQTLSVTTRSTQIELYFEQTKEDHEVKKFSFYSCNNRGINSFLKVRGKISLRPTAAARRQLLFCPPFIDVPAFNIVNRILNRKTAFI